MRNLQDYANIKNVIDDPEYAKTKNLKVYEKNGLYLIKYKKEFITNENVNTLGLFRSIITDGNKLLSVAPPKSIPLDIFKEYEYKNCDLQSFEEGTMINVFFNILNDQWEIATKSNIGANCTYNTEKTFRTMFLEAMNNIEGLEFEHLDNRYSYSFILQHPENKIVIPFKTTNLILCGIYEFNDFSFKNILYTKEEEEETGYDDVEDAIADKEMLLISETIEELKKTHPDWSEDKIHDTACDYVQIHSKEEELDTRLPVMTVQHIEKHENNMWEDLYEKIKYEEDYKVMGYVVVNKETGERTKIRNNNYEYVKKLKGNNLKLQYTYYNLRQHGNVKNYLHYFPEQGEKLLLLRKNLHDFTKKLYEYYVCCFIKKEKMLKEYPFKFKPHMYNLHQLFLDELRDKKEYITLFVVKNYINTLPIPKLMFSMNHDESTRKTDEIKNEIEKTLNSNE